MTTSDAWNRYAALCYFARLAKIPLGKTAMQKLAYLVQEIFQCPLGYSFRLYNYGPYSRGLTRDLDYLEAIHGLDIEYDSAGGYCIWPARRSEEIEKRASAFLSQHREKLDKVFDEFAARQAWQLEIYATAILVDRDRLRSRRGRASVDQIAREVAELKPKHDRNYIMSAVEELNERQYLRSTHD